MTRNEHKRSALYLYLSNFGLGAWIGFVALALAGILLVTSLGSYVYLNGLRNESIQHEAGLSAQYPSNQNFLSSFISGFYEQLGVAGLKSEKMDGILLDAVKGRYEKSGGFSSNGAFFSAVVEAYPDIKGLNVYDKIVNYISANREGYRARQDKLLDMLRVYDEWRRYGIIRSRIVSGILGIPSERLEARIGDQVLRGADARNKMYQIVLASDAKRAYETGVMEPLQITPSAPKK